MEPVGDFDLLAAALRADMSDMPAWMAALATKLAGALPDRVAIQHGGWLGNGPVNGVTADLGSWRYSLRMEHGRPLGERMHIVRGIALKTEPLPLDAWIDGLSAALAELAESSARERAAIMRLLH